MEWCLTRIVGEPQSVINWMVFQLYCFVCWRWWRHSRRIWAFSATFDWKPSKRKNKIIVDSCFFLSQLRSIPLESRICSIPFLWAKLCIQNRISDIETSTHIPSAEKCLNSKTIQFAFRWIFYNSSNRYFQSSMLCVSFIICTIVHAWVRIW